ncbi:MAG: aldehyde dehydrogenase family protein [Solirubrobacterales bacterium]
MTAPATALPGLGDAARELLGEVGNLIGGAWEPGAGEAELTSINPATGERIVAVPTASREQAGRAVAAARRAFDKGPWASAGPRERGELLLDLADLMEQNRDALVEIVVTEVGCPVSLSRAMQVGMPIANLRWAAEMALKGPQGGYEEMLPPDPGPPASLSKLRREPAGVVAGITGYNFPINSVVWKLGPGLAAGCTLVIKPSERTSLSTLALIRLADRAGFPPGVVSFLLGDGAVGDALVADPDVDLAMFTGSLEVGREIMRAAAQTTKRLVLELGGKSATVIMPGAALDEVTGPSIQRWARNAGQGCGATTRTLVPRGDYEAFAAASEAFISKMAVGDPWDERTDVGPLIRAEHRDFVESCVERAVASGAEVVAGGGRPDRDGFFMNPTVVGGVTNADEICREELFGPVGAIIPYDTLEEAIEIANDSDYGLHAAVYGPIEEALELANHFRTGAVSVNGGGFMHPRGPWGGFKQSGFGREMGDDGFREFFEVKHVQWPLR